VLVDAGGAERPAADAGGDLAAFEVAEEFLPFGVGGGAVFLGGPQCPAAGEEGQVGLDGFLGVGGLWRTQISQLSEFPPSHVSWPGILASAQARARISSAVSSGVWLEVSSQSPSRGVSFRRTSSSCLMPQIP
jgi:hypothetical protein